jgi:hypothetical protein
MPDMTSATAPKKINAAAEIKGGIIGSRKIFEDSKLTSAAGQNGAVAETAAVKQAQEKASASDVTTVAAAPVIGTDEAASQDALSPVPPVADITNDEVTTTGLRSIETSPTVAKADPRLREVENSGETREIAATTKAGKTRDNLGLSKPTRKAPDAETKPAAAVSMEGAGSLDRGALTDVATVKINDSNPANASFNEVAVKKTEASSGWFSAAGGGSIAAPAGHGAKSVVVDGERAAASNNGQPGIPQAGGDVEKVEAVASSAGNRDYGAARNASVPAVASAHSASGSIASSVTAVAIVPGSTPGEPVSTKLQITETGARSTEPTAGSGEHERAGLAPADEAPQIMTATQAALEVGVQSGTHGWLKVRAEMGDSGVVNASVSAASATGQEMLHRELPALSAYLQQEKVAVNSIVVHPSMAAGAEPRGSAGMAGTGDQTAQGGHDGAREQQHLRKAMLNFPDDATRYESVHGANEDGSLPLVTYAGGGSWLSVRA